MSAEAPRQVRARVRQPNNDQAPEQPTAPPVSELTVTIPNSIVEIRQRLQERLAELQPLHEEYIALRRIDDNIRDIEPSPEVAGAPEPTPRRSSGRVADDVMTIVAEHPEGISVSKIAEIRQTAPGYVYTIVRKLAEENKLTRRLGKIYPMTEATEEAESS